MVYLRAIIQCVTILCLLAATAFAEVEPIKEVFEPNSAKYSKQKFGKVAVVQWAPRSAPLTKDKAKAEAWKQQNRETLEKYIREAAEKDAKMVITPEFGIVGYPDIPDLPDEDDNFQSPEQVAPFAESLDGPSVLFFSKLAKELKIYIHFGFVERSQKGFHNTVVALDPKGEVVARYRKIHLYQNESLYLVEGNEIITYESEFGRVGIIICSDVYDSYPMDDYLKKNVDVMALSTSWAQYNTGWDAFTEGAIWAQAYLLAANQSYFPDSGVIEPDGKAQSHIRQSVGVAYGYLPYGGKKGLTPKRTRGGN